MKVPKFSPIITVPVLFIINFLAWLYIYDDYMMGWVMIYPIFMVVVTAFTIAAELAFGKPKRYKYVGINVCLVLLLLVLTQRFIPMDKIEQGLVENYYAHINADVTLKEQDKAIRKNDVIIVAKNFTESYDDSEPNSVEKLQVYQNGELLEEITLATAIQEVEKLMSGDNKAQFNDIYFADVFYAGVKQKRGSLGLNFKNNYVFFKYELSANEQGFIWDKERYKFAGLEMPRKEDLFNDETNKKFKQTLLKGNKEEVITVECQINKSSAEVLADLKNKGYDVIAEVPITVRMPFYKIANLAHEDYVEHIIIK